MKLIWNEIKKIINIKVLLLLGIITVMYFLLFLNIDLYPNGYPATTNCELSKDLIQRVGVSVEPEERVVLDEVYDEWVPIWNQMILEDKEFCETYGIDSWETFIERWSELSNVVSEYNRQVQSGVLTNDELEQKVEYQTYVALENRRNELFFNSHKDEAFMYQSIEYIKDIYDNFGDFNLSEEDWKEYWTKEQEYYLEAGITQTKQYEGRLKEIYTRDGLSLLPEETVQYFTKKLPYFAILLAISCLVVIVPFLVKDRLSHMESLLLTTKVGRTLIKKQGIAVFLSSTFLCLLQAIVFYTVLHIHEIAPFHNCLMTSIITITWWFDLTFLQYMLVTIAMAICFGVATGMIAFVVSKLSSNYVTSIAYSIPIGILFVLFCRKVFDMPFYMLEEGSKYREFYWLIGFIVITVGVVLAMIRHDKRREL